jgi:hypothetical protein
MKTETRPPTTQSEGFWRLAQSVFYQGDRKTHDLVGFIYLRPRLPQDSPGAWTVYPHSGTLQNAQRAFMYLNYLGLTENLNLDLHILPPSHRNYLSK